MKSINILNKIILIIILFIYTGVTFSYELTEVVKLKRNHLVFAIPVKFSGVDTTKRMNAHSKYILPLIFEPLLTIGPQQELVPILAKSWSASPNSLTVELKANHHFSDGQEVTANNVIRFIKYYCSYTRKTPESLQSLIGCKKGDNPQVQRLSKYKIKFDISSSPTAFLYQLASPKIVVMKKCNKGFIGSGPYQIKSIKKEYIILEKNIYYYGETTVKNSGVVLMHSPNASLNNLLKNNVLDGALMYLAVPENINNNYALVPNTANITEVLVFNNSKYPFNIPIIRKALMFSIYNNLSNNLPGMRKAYGIIPYGLGGSLYNRPPNNTNVIKLPSYALVDKAKLLLKKPLHLTIHANIDFKNQEIESAIINAGEIFNIYFTFKYYKNYQLLSSMYNGNSLDAFIDLYVFRDREAYSVLQFFTFKGSNQAKIIDMNPDKILKESFEVQHKDQRYQKYLEFINYFQDKAYVVPLYYINHYSIISKDVVGIHKNYVSNPFLFLSAISRIEKKYDR